MKLQRNISLVSMSASIKSQIFAVAVVIALAYPYPGAYLNNNVELKTWKVGKLVQANIVCIFFFAGLIFNTHEVVMILKKYWYTLLYGTIVILFITSLAGFVIAELPIQPYEYVIGMVVFVCQACSIGSVTSMVYQLHGNVSLSILLDLITTILACFTGPLMIKVILEHQGRAVKVEFTQLLKKIVLSDAVPLIVAKLLRDFIAPLRRFVDRFKLYVYMWVNFHLAMIVWQTLSSAQPYLIQVQFLHNVYLFLTVGVVHIVFLVFNFAACKLMFLKEKELKSIVITCSQKVFPAAISIVEYLPLDNQRRGLAIVACVFFLILQVGIDQLLVIWWSARMQHSGKETVNLGFPQSAFIDSVKDKSIGKIQRQRQQASIEKYGQGNNDDEEDDDHFNNNVNGNRRTYENGNRRSIQINSTEGFKSTRELTDIIIDEDQELDLDNTSLDQTNKQLDLGAINGNLSQENKQQEPLDMSRQLTLSPMNKESPLERVNSADKRKSIQINFDSHPDKQNNQFSFDSRPEQIQQLDRDSLIGKENSFQNLAQQNSNLTIEKGSSQNINFSQPNSLLNSSSNQSSKRTSSRGWPKLSNKDKVFVDTQQNQAFDPFQKVNAKQIEDQDTQNQMYLESKDTDSQSVQSQSQLDSQIISTLTKSPPSIKRSGKGWPKLRGKDKQKSDSTFTKVFDNNMYNKYSKQVIGDKQGIKYSFTPQRNISFTAMPDNSNHSNNSKVATVNFFPQNLQDMWKQTSHGSQPNVAQNGSFAVSDSSKKVDPLERPSHNLIDGEPKSQTEVIQSQHAPKHGSIMQRSFRSRPDHNVSAART